MYQYDLQLPDDENKKKKKPLKLKIPILIIVILAILAGIGTYIYKTPSNLIDIKNLVNHFNTGHVTTSDGGDGVVDKQTFLEVKNALAKLQKEKRDNIVTIDGVSQRNYDKLKQKNDSLAKDNDSLTKANAKLKALLKKLAKRKNRVGKIAKLKELRTLSCTKYKNNSTTIPSTCKSELDRYLNLYDKNNVFKITVMNNKKVFSVIKRMKNMDYALKVHYRVEDGELNTINTLSNSGLNISRVYTVYNYIKESLGKDTIIIINSSTKKDKKSGYTIKAYKY